MTRTILKSSTSNDFGERYPRDLIFSQWNSITNIVCYKGFQK